MEGNTSYVVITMDCIYITVYNCTQTDGIRIVIWEAF